MNYIRDCVPGAVEQLERDGKTNVQVQDCRAMRQGVGLRVTELMRINAEGDYAAIKALVDKYGLHFDPALGEPVLARYQKLGSPTYWAGINAQLTAWPDPDGAIHSVGLSYPHSVAEQHLAHASMNDHSRHARSTRVVEAISRMHPGH